MKITRRFTKPGQDPFANFEWSQRASRIANPDGSVVFEMADAEVPASWSQLATDIMVSKYFRKAGVPQLEEAYGLPGASPIKTDSNGEPILGPERSARQVIHRLAGCWRHWGEEHNYFDTAEDAQAFEDELKHMLVHQMVAPNSPQWFNTGLEWAYGINGPAQGHHYAEPKTGKVKRSEDSYTHPQPHACFIQSVEDDLVNDGGIMDLWVREARLFKYGSGTGTNFSRLRGEGELLSGGGKSSGLMSWLKIGDRAAGAIKSGGTTRRAAKMVCLDLDHPDIEEFVDWKVREELKVAALVEGMKVLSDTHKDAAERMGLTLDYDFNGESYQTVSGQNANNSVRVPDDFFAALDEDGDWQLINRLENGAGEREVAKTVRARDLWDRVGYAAWRCADPGVQYDSTINAWHTCPSSGRINASNPCSEYMFLDNTACNLASLNLIKFYDPKTHAFDVAGYEHGVDLWTIVLEISVLMAQFPSKEIAELSYRYRTLGLGYANIGAMLMQAGIPYDSEEARAVCGCLTAILTGRSYRMSALMAREHGPFAGYKSNKDHMLRVIRNHRRAAHGVDRHAKEWEELTVRPVPIDHKTVTSPRVHVSNARTLLSHATAAWDDALALGEKHGFRNAQTTVIAPTGTIGLLMDCDTTGVEPDFALVKFKKLAGGGYFKIANQSLKPALVALGYDEAQIRDILRFVLGTLSFDVTMPSADGQGELDVTFAKLLEEAGLDREHQARIEEQLPGMFELSFAFNAWSIGEDGLKAIGVDPMAAQSDMSWNLLRHMGLTGKQIDALSAVICGTQTVEGAPHLEANHLAVFDCASTCGKTGTRYISAEGHIRMMSAAQPFISGAISKTINLPSDATEEDIKAAYRLSWEMGLKANALYRDGCKLSQPLSTKSEDADDEDVLEIAEDTESVDAARDEVAIEIGRLALAAIDGDEAATRELVSLIERRPMRRRLPDTRESITHKFNIAGHEGYLTVGLYSDGAPGELFITMSKEGSTIGGVMDSLGTATSVALQYGVPIASLVRKFTHQRFEPAGMTTNRDIPFAKSLVDYIFRWMGMQFIPGYREQHAPKRDGMDSDGSVASSRDEDSGRDTSSRVVAHDARLRNTPVDEDDVVSVSESVAISMTSASYEAGDGSVRVEMKSRSVLSESLAECQEDAPPCDTCGTITVRNGTCYRCLNCGHSMGCS